MCKVSRQVLEIFAEEDLTIGEVFSVVMEIYDWLDEQEKACRSEVCKQRIISLLARPDKKSLRKKK